jgi:hypothetical protein
MEVKEFQELRDKIKVVEDKTAKAEGALDQIKIQLKKDFGLETLEKIESEITKINKEIDADEDKLDLILEEIENATDWNKI